MSQEMEFIVSFLEEGMTLDEAIEATEQAMRGEDE